VTRLFRAISLLALLLTVPRGTAAQFAASSANTVSMTGTIYSEDAKRPVEHANVRLADGGDNLLEESITNDSGNFSFRGLRRTNYKLTVDAVGYKVYSASIDLSFMSDRGMSIYLIPNPKDPANASAASSVSAHEMSMPQKARDLMASGEKKLYVDKSAQAALLDFQQAVSIAPGFYEAYYQLGMAFLTLGTRADAEKSFRKSIEVSNDKFGEPVIGLASFLIDSGDLAQSEKMTRHGLELSPNSWFGYYQLGRLLFAEKKIADAQKSAEQARSLSPDSAIVYRLLSNIHLSQKNYPALLEDLDAYIKLDPASPAGLRAKEIREQVAQQLSTDKLTPASSPAP
jgi:tetratricopeptide (TPR) repeat protein